MLLHVITHVWLHNGLDVTSNHQTKRTRFTIDLIWWDAYGAIILVTLPYHMYMCAHEDSGNNVSVTIYRCTVF